MDFQRPQAFGGSGRSGPKGPTTRLGRWNERRRESPALLACGAAFPIEAGAGVNATLLQLLALFASLSLVAVGGGAGVIPAMQRAAVDQHHWMSASQFLDAFALSCAAPGPGSLIAVLVGQKAAGLAGALVAAIGMYTPSCVAVFLAAKVWGRHEQAPWRALAERALAPVAAGMIFASALVLIRSTETGWAGWATTAAATGLLALTRLNPLWVLAAAALGFVGIRVWAA